MMPTAGRLGNLVMENKPYTIAKMPPGEWEKTGARLMKALLAEFNGSNAWTYLPSVLLLVGAGLLHKGGVPEADRDQMIKKYLDQVKEGEKKAAERN